MSEALDFGSQFRIGGITRPVGGEMQIPDSVRIGKEIKNQLGGPPPDSDPLANTELFGKDLLERGGNVPIPGRDIMEDLMSVEVGENGDTSELEEALRRAWAFREGLLHGPSGETYRFRASDVSVRADVRSKVAKLQNLINTVEGSMERPRADYVDIAIEAALDQRVRVAQDFRNDPDRYKNKIRKQLKRSFAKINSEDIERIVEERASSLAKDYIAIPKLIELSNHSKVRAMFDHAFRQRMSVCEDPGEAAKLGSAAKPASTPDGQHFAALFRGEGDYGQKLNLVFEEMVKVALPEETVHRLRMAPVDTNLRRQVPNEVYGVGFDNATMFATWLEHMLSKADGRMDVVWGAWKMMLTWEVADDLGQFVNEKGKFALAAPPIGNPLMTYLAHWQEKTMIEFGLNAAGERTQNEKFIAHSGLPLTLGHIPNLCEQYFIEAKVTFDTSYLGNRWMDTLIENAARNIPQPGDPDYESECFTRQEYFDKLRVSLEAFRNGTKVEGKDVDKITISLWDIWLYGRISFADKNFPWFATDQADIDPQDGKLATSGELPAGSVGMWFLTRGRSWGEKSGVGTDLKSIPLLRELGDPKFFTDRVRTWAKVLGTVSDDVPAEENVRMWWMLAVCASHQTGINKDKGGLFGIGTPKSPNARLYNGKSQLLKQDVKYVLNAPGEEPSIYRVGMDQKGVSWAEIFSNAKACGFLRQIDEDFIRKELNIQDTL